MRIIKLWATSSQTKQREIYTFGNASENSRLLPCPKLCEYLEFCFSNAMFEPMLVEAEFATTEEFLFTKLLNKEGKVLAVLKQRQNGVWKTIARDEEALNRLQVEVAMSFSELPVCITAQAVENFHGDLSEISQLCQYVVAKSEISAATEEARNTAETQEVLTEKFQTLIAKRDELKAKIDKLSEDLKWKQAELSQTARLADEKQKLFWEIQNKINRAEAVSVELEYLSKLREQNLQLKELLEQLYQKRRKIADERAECFAELQNWQKKLLEANKKLDKVQLPTQSAATLVDSLKVNVKIDETRSQLEKIRDEIILKESQIAEKENNLSEQQKRFRSVAELDVAVSPVKAKNTILQVLEAKYSKLEAVNASLEEKRRNLERALDDYNCKISEIEASRAKLAERRERALLRKQEEFKRAVYLNGQRASGDATGVFAVSADFNDVEIQTYDQEISQRNADRDLLIMRAAQVKGALKEIKRHSEINFAEMEALNGEKQNINRRYNEIVSQGSSEAVFNYLKALQNNTGTKYLLDLQQNVVQSDSEVAELKKTVGSLRQSAEELQARLDELKASQHDEVSAADISKLVVSEDRLREGLSDVWEQLTFFGERYAAAKTQLEEFDSKLARIDSAVTEAEKTVKVNLSQIKTVAQKAQNFVEVASATATEPREEHTQEARGPSEIEQDKIANEVSKLLQSTENLRYESDDVQTELQMLTETAHTLSDDVLSQNIELQKLKWVYAELCQKCDNHTSENINSSTRISENVFSRRVLQSLDMASQALAEKIAAQLCAIREKACKIANRQIKLREEGGNLVAVVDGNALAYDELPTPLKTAVYVAFKLASKATDGERCFVFDQSVAELDGNALAEMLTAEGVSFVTDVETTSLANSSAETESENPEESKSQTLDSGSSIEELN